MKYDIIIIGSGLGGLVCGVILSRAGFKVGILEKAHQPGGCMQSYKRDGLCFDTGLHYVGGLEDGQSLYNAFRYLGLLNLPWKKMDEHFDHVIIGKREYLISQGYENFVDCLSEDFPALHNQIRIYADRLQHIREEDMDVNAWQYLKDTLIDSSLIDAVSAPAMKVELEKDTLPLFSFLHSMRSYIESSWRLQGDGNMITENLINTILDNGGDVICDSEVVSIRDTDHGLINVLCCDGREYTADYYISDIHPSVLCSMLDIKISKSRRFIRRMKTSENTYGAFTTSIVLKPEALRYLNHNAYIYDGHVWDSNNDAGAVKKVLVSCRYPEGNSEYAQQIDLLTPMAWSECAIWANTKVGNRPQSYRDMCERKSLESIHLAERFIPCLGDMIEKKYTSTPITYRDYLGCPQGTAFGIRKDYRMSMFTYQSVKTPLQNLLLTGQNIVMPGVEGVTMTAFDTCRHIIGSKYIDNILKD